MTLDDLDVRLIELLTLEPGLSNVQVAKRLGVARHTVQARLTRLHETGVIEGIVPRLNPEAFGYGLAALCRLQIDQRVGHDAVMNDLVGIPEVTDLYTVSGDFDISMRVVATSNVDLQRVFDLVAHTAGVVRLTSSIILKPRLQHRTLDLIRRAGQTGDGEAGGGTDGSDGETPRNGLATYA